MEHKIKGFLYILCLFTTSQFCEGRRIEVYGTSCDTDTTYNVGAYNKLTLSYDEYGRSRGVQHLSRCIYVTFTIVNTKPNSEICIVKQRTSFLWDKIENCAQVDSVLQYYIGYAPERFRHGESCSSYINEPLCTTESTVYAVFEKKSILESIRPFEVTIFTRELVDTTVCTIQDITTIPHQHPADKSEDDELGKIEVYVIVPCVVIGFIAIICFMCSRLLNGTRRCELQERPVQYTPHPRTRSEQQAYTQDAPSYSDVMQQELPVSGEENTGQITDHVTRREPAARASSVFIPNSYSQPLGPTETHATPCAQGDRRTIPTVPPPDYSDIEPPPAYPGY